MRRSYAMYKEVLAPTTVEHCLQARITSPHHDNLVIARSSWLELYRLTEEASRQDNAKYGEPFLEIVSRFQLSGKIEGLQALRFPDRARDSLVVVLPEARFSILDWDSMQSTFKTTFMFSLDEERSLLSPSLCLSKPPLPILRVHPEGKCVVLLAYQLVLLVFPVGRQQGSRVAQLLEPFRVELQTPHLQKRREHADFSLDMLPPASSLELGPHGLLDLAFLEGYAEPSLALLHQTRLTWAGRYAVAERTNLLLTLSLDLLARSVAVVSRVEGLPHSCHRLAPVPLPVGGVLVMGPDLVLHFRGQVMDAGLALNAFGTRAAANMYGAALQEAEQVLAMDNPQSCWLTPEDLLVGVASGQIYLLTLQAQGVDMAGMTLTEVGNSAIASCLIRLSDSFCFLGAALGPSVLIEFSRRKALSDQRVADGAATQDLDQAGTKELLSLLQEEPSQEPDVDANLGFEKKLLESLSAAEEMSLTEEGKMLVDSKEAEEAEYSSRVEAELRLIFEGGAEPQEQEDESRQRKRGRQEGLREVSESKEFFFRVVDLLFGTGPIPSFDTGHAYVAALHEEEEEEVEQGNDERIEVQDEEKGAKEDSNESGQDTAQTGEDNSKEASVDTSETEGEAAKKPEERAVLTKAALRAATSDVTEVVGVAGHGADGALAVMQPGVLAEVVDFSPLDFVATGTWALLSAPIDQTAEELSERRQGEDDQKTEPWHRQEAHHTDKGVASSENGPQRKRARHASDQDVADSRKALDSHVESQANHLRETDAYHAFLLISSTDSTRILATGLELQESNPGGFFEDGPTLAAGNVWGSRCGIVQVHSKGARLVDKGQMLDEAPLEAGVVQACVQDPYILTRLRNGSLCLLFADSKDRSLRVSLPRLAALPPSTGAGTQASLQDLTTSAGSEPAVAGKLQSLSELAARVSAVCMWWDRQGTLTQALEATLGEEDKWQAPDEDEEQDQLMDEEQKEPADGPSQSGLEPAQEIPSKLLLTDAAESTSAPTSHDMDELEALFFGQRSQPETAQEGSASPSSSVASSTSSSSASSVPAGNSQPAAGHSVPADKPGMRLAAVCRRSGLFELYVLPDFQRVFWCAHLSHGPWVLSHRKGASPEDDPIPTMICPEGKSVHVTDLCLTCLGPPSCNQLPVLMVLLSSGALLVYKSFLVPGSMSYSGSKPNRPPQVRFVRVQFSGPGDVPLLRPKQTDKSSFRLDPRLQRRRKAQQRTLSNGTQEEEQLEVPACSRFTLFSDLSGYRNALLTLPGQPTIWIFSPRGWPRFHPCLLPVPGCAAARALSCVTPFHNINCERGFIAFDQSINTTLFICRLPSSQPHSPHSLTSHHTRHPPLQLSKSADAVSQQPNDLSPPAGATVHFVTRQVASGTYGVVVSRPEPEPRLDDDDPRLLPVTYPAFELLLLSPAQGWQIVGRWSDFNPREAVLSASAVTLEGDEYVLMGTTNMEGEDVDADGRMIMLHVFWAMGMDRTGREMQMLKVKPISIPEKTSFDKGPVTAVAQLEGFVVTALGPRLRLYQLKPGKKLSSRAFCDVYSYVTTLNTLKNFIIFGDVTKSLMFGIFDKSIQQLVVLGRDLLPLRSLSAQFLVDGQSLNLVLSAEEGNLHFFRYAAHLPEAQRFRLLPVADFHTGLRVAHLKQMRLRGVLGGDCPSLSTPGAAGPSALPRTAKGDQVYSMGGMLLGSSLEGSLLRVCPMNEVVFRRLQALHTALTFSRPHLAGLNPREWRVAQRGIPSFSRSEVKKGVLDGDLLWSYITLEWKVQLKLASDIGTTPDQIIDNLRQLEDATCCLEKVSQFGKFFKLPNWENLHWCIQVFCRIEPKDFMSVVGATEVHPAQYDTVGGGPLKKPKLSTFRVGQFGMSKRTRTDKPEAAKAVASAKKILAKSSGVHYKEVAGSEEKRLKLCKEVAECSEDKLREQNHLLLQALLGASRISESHEVAMASILEIGCETCCYYPCENCGELNNSEDQDNVHVASTKNKSRTSKKKQTSVSTLVCQNQTIVLQRFFN
eukprot:g66929.t1